MPNGMIGSYLGVNIGDYKPYYWLKFGITE